MEGLKQGSTLHGGKYTIVKTLGQGSFGITYLAKTRILIDGQLGKMNVNVNVTIKEFFMSDMNSRAADGTNVEKTSSTLVTNYRHKFRREAENLSHLNHPNIVKVLEVFDENNTTYYVMEYIDGETVDDYIKGKGKLSEDESLKITQEVCSALSYMHEHRMLHLDLKPKNIMRSAEGKIVLIDFGLAKQYNDNGEPESSTSLGLGTPGYAPIEQSHYKQDGTFPVTLDIYAVGASLFKMLTGKTPPESSYVLNDGLPLPVLKSAGVSTDVISIVEKAMAPIKKNRYQEIAALSKAISNLTSFDELEDERTQIFVDDEKTAVIEASDSKQEPATPLPTTDSPKDVEKEKDWKSLYKTTLVIIPLVLLLGVILYLTTGNNSSGKEGPQTTGMDSIAEVVKDSATIQSQAQNQPSQNASLAQSSKKEEQTSPSKQEKNAKEVVKTEKQENKKEVKEEKTVTTNEQTVPHETTISQQTSSNNTTTVTETKTNDEDNRIYEMVEENAQFPGGDEACINWLGEHLVYPPVAEELGIQGHVMVNFVVEKDGTITNVTILRSPDPSLSKEAERLVKMMPKWKPARQGANVVRAHFNLPIRFRLN